MESFADAAAWPSLTDPFRRFWQGSPDGPRKGRDTVTLFDGWPAAAHRPQRKTYREPLKTTSALPHLLAPGS